MPEEGLPCFIFRLSYVIICAACMFYSVHKFSGLVNAIKSDSEFWQRLNLYTGESGGGPCGVVYDFLSSSREQI